LLVIVIIAAWHGYEPENPGRGDRGVRRWNVVNA
jgi:hypothetical protein